MLRYVQANYETAVADMRKAEEHARAAETAKAVQESETKQAQLRITELLSQAKRHAKSHEVGQNIPNLLQAVESETLASAVFTLCSAEPMQC